MAGGTRALGQAEGRSFLGAFIGIILLALSLRTVITSFSPLLEMVAADVRLGSVQLGIIAAAPTLAYVLSGSIAPRIAATLGLERTAIFVLVAMGVGQVTRALVPEGFGFTGLTVVIMFMSGIGNVIAPALIKRYFPGRIGTVTAGYVAALSLSSAIPALVAVPIADKWGWRISLCLWGVYAVIAAIPWWVASGTGRDSVRARPSDSFGRGEASSKLPLSRSMIAWSLVGLFAMCSLGGFAMLAWLPTILTDTTDLNPAAAGVALALFAVCGFPIAVFIPPVVAKRPASVVPIILVGVLSFLVGYIGLFAFPNVAPMVWVLALGLGSLPYPLVFTLMGTRTRSQETALRLSGFVQTVGYAIAAIGPFVVGLLYERTNAWDIPLGFLAAAVALGLPALFILHRTETVEDEHARRTAATSSAPRE